MKSQKKGTKKSAPAAAVDPGDVFRSWLLAGVVTLCVARPLLPSEGVSWLGDGQPFNLMWLMLATATLLLSLARGGLARKLDVVDLGVGALVLACAASALVGSHNPRDEIELGLTGRGSPRLAINMLWEWVALGLVFFLVRQLVWTAREARALVAVMVALAVVLACYGFYQVFVSLPAARVEYAENPDQVLTRLNQWFPAGSPERARFENRLNSNEPLATFALTNSLAGFLAPWLLAALAIAGSYFAGPRVPPGGASENKKHRLWAMARAAGLTACIVAVAGCFVLTKSRSGYIALAAGVVLLPFAAGWGRRWLNWRTAAAGGAALVVLVTAAWLVKGLDAQVITEASKSLGYRLEYWQATLEMIATYPFLGVGPGNFQDYYTQFKLPQASEEIRDPHNFLLEVWATGGTLALVALCLVLGVFAWRTCLSSAQAWGTPPIDAAARDTSPRNERRAGESTRNARFIFCGAAAGFLWAFLVGPLVGSALTEEQVVGGLLIGAAVVAVLWPWVMGGSLPARLPAVGVLVLAIHLLASGGIAFPGVADTFWLLLALGLNQLDGEPPARSTEPPTLATRAGITAAVALSGCAAAACFSLACRPVLNCRALLTKAEEPGLDTQARIKNYLAAAEADPMSAEPWRAIAELEFARLTANSPSPRSSQYFAAAAKRINELEPHSSSIWRQTGRWYSELYERSHDSDAAEIAVESYRNAVDLYPNFPTLRGEYALALAAVGDKEQAHQQAQAALQLDEQTPHADKKLAADLKQRLESL